MGLCKPEEDLVVMTQFSVTRSKMQAYEEQKMKEDAEDKRH